MLAGGEEDRGCPGRKQIETGDKFGGKSGQEGPMPSQQAEENAGYNQIQQGVGR